MSSATLAGEDKDGNGTTIHASSILPILPCATTLLSVIVLEGGMNFSRYTARRDERK
jgi:hypothetical protein